MAAIRFCGCSVINFNSGIGWGGNKSFLEVNVVQDDRNGDFFNPPPLGYPCYFYFGASYHFWGLLYNWKNADAIQGRNVYTLRLEDPRDILEGTQLFLNGYNGSTFNVYNILNCYGYWENNLGYGSSNANEGGMPWSQVLAAVQALTNTPGQTPFGGPLNYRGISYAVDLSLLPVPPADYRIGAGGQSNMSLLDAIQQICDDGGCDFFVELDPGAVVPVIRVYTVSRYMQPPLGTIANIVSSNWGGTVKSSDNGLELRNTPTSKFLVGGAQQQMYETLDYQPFWGYDIDGTPIQNLVVTIPGLGTCNAAYVNAQEISSVFNGFSSDPLHYFLTEFELRFALGDAKRRGAWEQYVVYETIELNPTNNPLGFVKAVTIGPEGVKSALQADGNNNAAKVLSNFFDKVGASQEQIFKQGQLLDFVKKIATNWYGKKYWVPLPFMVSYLDPTTLVVHNSQDITDGAWTNDVAPLGLSDINGLKFKQPDGKFEAVVAYDARGVDLAQVSPQDTIIQGNTLYTKMSVEKTIVRWPLTGTPTVVATINNPISLQVANIGGDLNALATVFRQADGRELWKAFQGRRAFGTLNVLVAAPRVAPTALAIPTRSNISTYGPWYYAGPPGKVIVEQAPDLVPWEYGGSTYMELAAIARVTSSVTFMQLSEMGRLELVGLPLASLGATLLAGGPNLTNVDVRYGKDGIITSYAFRTFTESHLNRFIAGTQEKLKRTGRLQNEIRKSILLSLVSQNLTFNSLAEVNNDFFRRLPKWQISASPTPVIISSAVEDGSEIRISTAICDAEEAWTGIGGGLNVGGQEDAELFKNSSIVSLSAILRPFSNNTDIDPELLIPQIEESGIAGDDFGDNAVLHTSLLNPYNFVSSSDLEYVLGSAAPTEGNYIVNSEQVDLDNIRGVGMSMPMMCVGWGYDIDGDSTPDPFNADAFKAGPLDPLWDYNRGVWSVHDLVFGRLRSACSASGTASMQLWDRLNPLQPTLNISNFFNSAIPSGKSVVAGYMPYSNKWVIIAADC